MPWLVTSSIERCDTEKLAIVRPLRIAGDVTSDFVLEYRAVLAILDREPRAV
jgi:hypothetical protein